MKHNTIWIIDHTEIAQSALDKLTTIGYVLTKNPSKSDLSKIIGIFVRTYTQVDHNLISTLPNLQFVLKAGVGLDNIDLDALQARNIDIYNAPGSNAKAVAEYVIGNTIHSLRRLYLQSQQITAGQWRSYAHIGQELSGKVIGLIGFGAIGRELAKRLLAFDTTIIAYDPYIQPDIALSHSVNLVSLDDLLSRADVISLQSPLTIETSGMINHTRISQMKDGVVLINVSRGELINENDLIMMSKTGKFGGLVLDVFSNEPHINRELITLPNTILTPHIAGFTVESHERMALLAVNNLLNKKMTNNL